MNLQFYTFVITNTIAFGISYYIKYKTKEEYNEKLNIILHRITKLEVEVSELHETLDTLEEALHKKHTDMRVSHEQLGSKIDKFIVSNYDIN